MKRSELFFGAVLVPLDFTALFAAGVASYFIRVSPTFQGIRPAIFQFDLPLLLYIQLISIVSAVIIVIFALQGLYAMRVTRRILDEWSRIFSGITIGLMLVILYMFLSAELFQSRFILLSAYVIGLIFVISARYSVRLLQRSMLNRGFGVHNVMLVGNGRYAAQLANIFRKNPQLGYRIVGTPDLVRWEELRKIYSNKGIDEIIQTDPTMPEDDLLLLLDFAERYKIDFKYIPNLFETHAANVKYRQIGGVPVVELGRTPLDGWGRIAKRVLDLTGAMFGLILFSPILLLTALAIKLDTAGPVLYKQTRLGRNKASFAMYKFRSMGLEYCTGDAYGGKVAEHYEKKLRAERNQRPGPLFKMRNDPRITKIGRIIRRWRIDELPQFLNVLRGEMSLLGPRPHLPQEVARYSKHHEALFTIKPGMSGMAQVNGNAGLTFDQEASLDLAYIETWSLRLDIILLLKTFLLLKRDKNAI